MLLAKDSSQILIMKNIGFSYKDIRIQYITRSIVIVLLGIVTGTCIAATFGEMLVSWLGSFMGAGSYKVCRKSYRFLYNMSSYFIYICDCNNTFQ